MSGSGSDTALLLMDFQEGVVDMVEMTEIAEHVESAAAAARKAGALVVWGKVGMRSGSPEIHPGNQVWGQMVGTPIFEGGGSAIAAAFAPQAEDLIVDKKRISTFAGNDLEMILRAKGIQNLVLAGIFTSGVVLSTLSAAADKDFGLVVLSDACGDADEESHRVLIEKIFPRDAEVLTTDEWCTRIAG